MNQHDWAVPRRSMRLEERHEMVLETLEDLREASLQAPVVVEGKNDEEALRSLEVTGEIVTVNGGSSIFGLCETLARDHPTVIILTDWDRRGGQLCRLLREGLAANDVRYNAEIRGRLARLCRKDIKDVEGLRSYVARMSGPPRKPAMVV